MKQTLQEIMNKYQACTNAFLALTSTDMNILKPFENMQALITELNLLLGTSELSQSERLTITTIIKSYRDIQHKLLLNALFITKTISP